MGDVALIGPSGPVPLGEPSLIALLALLAVAGDAGVSEDDLLLRLTPEATAARGRTELARLIADTRALLGGESSVARTANGYALSPRTVSLDVRVLAGVAERECTNFLAAFELSGSPEFDEWVGATRWQVEPLPAAEPATAAPRSRRRTIGVTIIALLILIAAAAAYLSRPRRIEGFATGDTVLLADIRNETGDSLFQTGILSAATITLQQSGRLRLYPRSRLGDVYRLMQITNRDTALTFELSQEVAERDDVRFVLGLQVDRDGSGYRVTGRVFDVEQQKEVVETSSPAQSKSDALIALDRVLLTIRKRLGESRDDLNDRAMALPMVTTRSLEALRSFAEGSRAWAKSDYRLAGELWHRAVDIDTGFAMAYGSLGSFYYYHHERAKGEHYYDLALQRANRLTERERLRLLESQAGYRGDVDSSLALTKVIAGRYPSVTTWYNHGTNLMQSERYSEALAAFRTALTYDSTHVNSYLNSATTAKAMNRNSEALRYYARAGRLDSASLYRSNINHEWGGTLVQAGRYAEAESAFRRMAAGTSVGNRALGLRSLGYLAQWRGRMDESIEFYRQATSAAVQLEAPLSEARNRMLLATSYRITGRHREASGEVARAFAMMGNPQFEPRFLAILASSCIKTGRVADVDSILRVLRTRVNRNNRVDLAAEAFVSAAVSLANHRPDSALYFARQTAPLGQHVPTLMLEAEAFRAMGHSDSARVTLSRLLSERGFGSEGQDDWLRAPLILGDLLVAQGDSAGGMKAYQRLLAQWRDAPASVPDVVAVRTRVASLSGAHQ